jgi:uncharacterized protein
VNVARFAGALQEVRRVSRRGGCAGYAVAMARILVDADACPVKEEIYRVARRVGVPVLVVANARLQVPLDPLFALVVVAAGQLDDADDHIAATAAPGDVVVTNDIPLAARCLSAGAQVLRPDGSEFSAETIGDELASRELLAGLREAGTRTSGQRPFSQQDRSRFLHRLDAVLRTALRLG